MSYVTITAAMIKITTMAATVGFFDARIASRFEKGFFIPP
jgi:hypothetical protein